MAIMIKVCATFLVVVGLMFGHLHALSELTGTAGLYDYDPISIACNQSLDTTNKKVATVADVLWDNGSACGRVYAVMSSLSVFDCIVSTPDKCGPTWTNVTIVDYCQGCKTTMNFSKNVFNDIAPAPFKGSDIMEIVYTSYDAVDTEAPAPTPIEANPPLVGPPPAPAPENNNPPLVSPPPENTKTTLAEPPLENRGRSKKKEKVILGASIIGFFLLAGGVTTIIRHMRRKKAERKQEMIQLGANHGPKCYKYSEIRRMIGSKREELGRGGFGVVYKGKISNEDCLVAVKVLEEVKDSGTDFINEVQCISKISHNNCIKLLGYCHKKGKRALIYELMPKGSLEKYIPKANQPEDYRLGWEARFTIATAIAKGLNYLHHEIKPAILHLDIKPHNILLDHDFTPKLSDFGLARLFPGDRGRSFTMTDTPRGTRGYVAPEVHDGTLSKKADVYSYGVLLLDMVGGRETSKVGLNDWIYNRQDSKEDVEQYGITTSSEEEIAVKMIFIGLKCIEEYGSRPEMSVVLEMLKTRTKDLLIEHPRPLSPLVKLWPGSFSTSATGYSSTDRSTLRTTSSNSESSASQPTIQDSA